MKQIHILFFLITTLFGCNKSDEKLQVQDLLIGQWKLTTFVDEANGTSIDANNPNYFDPIDNVEVDVLINFNELIEYTGTTTRNSFGGNFTLNNSETVLIFIEEYTTEVNETEFGNLFFDNLRLNYNQQTQNTESGFEINGNVFKLYYSENEYMKFEKL